MEFQGEFEYSDGSEAFDDLELGVLNEVSKGTFDLKIGNHLLKGKIVDLVKPLLITEKSINPATQELELLVRAIIKRKILFGSRPTPLKLAQRSEDGVKRLKLN